MKFTIYAIRYECIDELLQTNGTYSGFLHRLCVAKVSPLENYPSGNTI